MKLGIADTMFARINMAEEALKVMPQEIEIERYTVPGFKDLPVAAKKLIEEHNCNAVIALGWVGKEDIDETCAHEANLGLIHAELLTNTHILKIFFHEKETSDEQKQKEIAIHRVQEHTKNAIALMKGKTTLTERAGKGIRQGYKNAGELQ